MGSIRKSTATRLCFCSFSALLLSLNLSSATFNPAFHPQNGQPLATQPVPEQAKQYQGTREVSGEPLRGGSTMLADPQFEYQEPEPFQPPKVHLKHMSMALRLTSEWNRRLHDGVKHFKRVWGQATTRRSQDEPHQTSAHAQYQYGHHPVNINPSRSWHPPIPEGPDDEDEEELSLFHAKTPRAAPASLDSKSGSHLEPRGVAIWGPELLPYLQHIVDLLEVSDGVEIPLAMIYLDRACSVETPRSNGVPPCPFCTPRTVHRLSLVALILAKQAIDGEQDLEGYYEKLQSLGIPLSQLQPMVDWMRSALGDPGLLVTVGQMKDWSQTWDAIFFPKQLPAVQQKAQLQLNAPEPVPSQEAPLYANVQEPQESLYAEPRSVGPEALPQQSS